MSFERLLTDGAKSSSEHVANALGWPSNYPAMLLEHSKPWRGELWKAFAEIERRLCPQPGVTAAAPIPTPSEPLELDGSRPKPQPVSTPLDFDALPRPSKSEYVQGPDSAAPGDFSKPRKCVGCGFVMMLPTGILCASCEMDEDTQSLMDRDRE